ncbi:MAG: serine/threonine protein kinase [Chloroflexi bacterium]|jgi:serine/threonine protein kinase/tetratricopeptide (TPR) repeat protein|nr:serine/threonine protein kinase [Chloroflexota bacterium]
MPFVVGENIGPYRLLEKLGQGGMATVYRAYHARLDRDVAIKALHPAFMEDPNFLARFEREAQVVARLEHPNIVPIYDFAEHEGRPYLVMKFIEGETLKARLNRASITDAELLETVDAVGGGLAYAHEQGILHRDIKPSNVLLAADGRIYLADFGLARIAHAGESTLSGDMMLGTPQYISPEQAMGVSELDNGTDIYSFGVMLYELIVGQVPFSADTPFSIIHDHIYTPLPLPRNIRQEIPESLERVLLKALAKERGDRFDTVDALLEAFRKAIQKVEPDSLARPRAEITQGSAPTLAPEPVRAESTSEAVATSVEAAPTPQEETPIPSGKGKKKLRRNSLWRAIIIGVVLIFCCLVVFAIAQNRQPEFALDAEPAATEIVFTDRVEEILAQITDNPEEPYTYLELASAYLEINETISAEAAVDDALLYGADDFEVYRKAAAILAHNESWVKATQVYLAMRQQNPQWLVNEMENFHQAAYMAAALPGAGESIPIPAVAQVDQPFERILKARNILFNDSALAAQPFLDETLLEFPDYAEAKLLQIEIYQMEGKIDTAILLIEDLRNQINTPPWILNFIEKHFENILLSMNDSLESAEALTLAVEQSPDDPWLRLELVDALLRERQFALVEAQMLKVGELAGEDPEIYLHAAEILQGHERYLFAARYYILAIQMGGEAMRERVADRHTQMIYLGSVGVDALQTLRSFETEIDALTFEVARIRNILHHDNAEVAAVKMVELKAQYPDAPEVLLLDAEILYLMGNEDAALQQWRDLINQKENPLWIREQARVFLQKFNQ